MGTEENLIPLNKRTKEEQRIIQSMGGSVKSPRKKLMARIRELKKKGLTNDDAKRLVDMMTDPDILDLDILMGLQSLKKTGDIKTILWHLVSWWYLTSTSR